MDWRSLAKSSQDLHQPVVHRTIRWRTGQCPMHRLVQQQTCCSRESMWLKFTGLFGGAPDCPVSHQRLHLVLDDELIALGSSPRAPRLKFTGLSGESTVPTANGRQRDQRATHGPSQRSPGRTGQCPVCQGDRRLNGRLRQIRKETGHRTGTVHVRWCTTEGKNCLPNGTPTTPSYLGAIKGTPRHMDHVTKHPLNILRCLDFATTHLDHRD
jgi:hypothetical protein